MLDCFINKVEETAGKVGNCSLEPEMRVTQHTCHLVDELPSEELLEKGRKDKK